MTPNIIDVPKFTVVGLEAKFISILSPDKTNDIVIPRLWKEYIGRAGEIPHRVAQEDLGLVYCLDDEPKSHPNECLYICAARVDSTADMPAGMVAREVPGGKYAVFAHRAAPDAFEHTMKFIYGSWFPESGYQFDNRPEMEVYAAGVDGWDIYIPIK